jgi:SAM-dependent methyltransferase
VRANPYESAQYLSEYLLFHYGRPGQICPLRFVPKEALRFHERIRLDCLLPLRPRMNGGRGLDLGCGVGRFTFELGLVLDEVLGVDNSKRFIVAARQMAHGRGVTVRVRESGAQFSKVELALPQRLRGAAVRFQVGDAMNLGSYPNGTFNVVAAINLICRLPSPRRFLGQLHRIVAPGGQLLIGSPFSWLGAYTPPREWLDIAGVIRLLTPHFKLVRRQEMPFVIREHRRKYQLVISEVLTFVRSE